MIALKTKTMQTIQIAYEFDGPVEIRELALEILGDLPFEIQDDFTDYISFEDTYPMEKEECLTVLNNILSEFDIEIEFVDHKMTVIDTYFIKEENDNLFDDWSELEWYVMLDVFIWKLEWNPTFKDIVYEMKDDFCDDIIDDVENYLRQIVGDKLDDEEYYLNEYDKKKLALKITIKVR